MSHTLSVLELSISRQPHFYMFHSVLSCVILTALSNRDPATGGGEHMEIVISFLVAVAAGVTCHLICKWLDSHNKDNE